MAMKPDYDDFELTSLTPDNIQERPDAAEQGDDDELGAMSERKMSEREMIAEGKIDKKTYPELEEIDQEVISDIYQICKKKELNIIFTGYTGSGKSALGNAIATRSHYGDAFKECHGNKACTLHASPQTSKQTGFTLRAWDSPGLRDDRRLDSEYVAEIDCILQRFQPGDLMVFCIEARSRFATDKPNEQIKALLRIKNRCGLRILKESLIIALTKVDTIAYRGLGQDKKQCQDRIKEYNDDIRNALVKHVGLNREDIKIFPVQHEQIGDTLPDGTRWLSSFWFGCLNAIPKLIGDKNWQKYFKDIDKLATPRLLLNDSFLPEELLKEKRRGRGNGAAIGAIGLIAGPVAIVTIPVGAWVGGKRSERKYDEQIRQK